MKLAKHAKFRTILHTRRIIILLPVEFFDSIIFCQCNLNGKSSDISICGYPISGNTSKKALHTSQIFTLENYCSDE